MFKRIVGWVGPPIILAGVILLCFTRLAGRPNGLIVDIERASVDTHIRGVKPTPGNDLTRQYLPRLIVHHRELRLLGRIPAWDDTGFGGRPLIGNPQAGLFYPPVWVVWWVGNPAGLGWLTLIHLLWCGIGVHLLGRAQGLGSFAALFAAVSVVSAPYVILQIAEGHYPHIWAFAWYPWAVLAYVRGRDGARLSGLCLAPILAVMFLTGHAQEWLYLVIALAIWAIMDGSRIGAGNERKIGRLFYLPSMVLLAIGMVSLELFPVQLAQEWTLKGTKHTLAESGSYHVTMLNLLQMISPKALRDQSTFLGEHNLWETQIGLGFASLSILVAAVYFDGRKPLILGWAVVVFLSVWFALGAKFGLYALAYKVIPGMDRFRVPARALFLGNLAAGMLAGYGIEALWKEVESRRKYLAIGSLIVVLLIFFMFSVTIINRSVSSFAFSLRTLAANPLSWIYLGTTALFVSMSLHRRYQKVGVLLLVCVALAERVDYAHSVVKVSNVDSYLGDDPVAAAMPDEPGNPFRIRVDDTIYDDSHAFQAGRIKTNSYDSFQLQYPADLYETLYPMFEDRPFLDKVGPMAEVVAIYRGEVRQAVMDRMSVRYLVTSADQKPSSPVVGTGSLNRQKYQIMRNESALPRAYVVPGSAPSPGSAKSILSEFRLIDPREQVLMESAFLVRSDGDRQAFTKANFISTDPDHPRILVRTEAPGLLVITDTWMPGWSAAVDGHPTPIYRGNHAQRVVAIETPGDHEIQLDYQPPGFASGLAISILATVIWGTVFVRRLVFELRFA